MPPDALLAKMLSRTEKSWPCMYMPYFAFGSAAPSRAMPMRLL